MMFGPTLAKVCLVSPEDWNSEDVAGPLVDSRDEEIDCSEAPFAEKRTMAVKMDRSEGFEDWDWRD